MSAAPEVQAGECDEEETQAMLRKLKNAIRSVIDQNRALKPEGDEGIQELGHRAYVGGMWREIGKLQFDFIVSQGLEPSHCLLDIACGSLRGGVHFVHYLDAGNYLGIDKEGMLIKAGVRNELGEETLEEKRPEFVVSDNFGFHAFSKKPHFSIAQSLFTHLNPTDICLCLKNLKEFVETGHVCFATYSEGRSSANTRDSHSHASFNYTRGEMEAFGEDNGWSATHIGDWGHPRQQFMLKYEVV